MLHNPLYANPITDVNNNYSCVDVTLQYCVVGFEKDYIISIGLIYSIHEYTYCFLELTIFNTIRRIECLLGQVS